MPVDDVITPFSEVDFLVKLKSLDCEDLVKTVISQELENMGGYLSRNL